MGQCSFAGIRADAQLIWDAAVHAVRPQRLVRECLTTGDLADSLHSAPRIIVVGAGKAGAAMAEGVEAALAPLLDRVVGWVNVPDNMVRPLKKIQLHAARPAGHNYPTAEGVAGSEQILRLVQEAGPDDVVLCLLSGGGSALLPAPVEGVTLQDKQHMTQLLHACGATIHEMNAVRKHLSRIKGGRLAQTFHGKKLLSLIISDVIGDPLDVIASGPTAPDPTTFGDALQVLDRFGLTTAVAPTILAHLRRGRAGDMSETPKQKLPQVQNVIIGNADLACEAAEVMARQLGYVGGSLGADWQGETASVVERFARVVESPRPNGELPHCFIVGGETTVKLAPDHGLGGRNQQFVLALTLRLGAEGLWDKVLFSAGTDGEDGPTDAAGAFADASTLRRASALGLNPQAFLDRNDAYHFFEATGDLFKPGLTETNVMDLRIVLALGQSG